MTSFPISVAPMMDWTDRHERYFLRLISKDVRLYTEMITAQAIIFGNRERLLAYDALEHPLALQLGGSDPNMLAESALIGEAYGYDEINLNVGCPSARVRSGQFGACLMLDPCLVARCIEAMTQQVKVPVTIKCRIGVDDQDSYESLYHFIKTTHQANCQTYIIHARKAWLQGLSPKQNREIPPLRYDLVQRLKSDFKHLHITVNGGICDLSAVKQHLTYADGVMIGRKAYQAPYFLAEIQQAIGQDKWVRSRKQVIRDFFPYIENQLRLGVRLASITRHLHGLFQGQYGAAKWRRYLSEHAHKPGTGINVLEQALAWVEEC